MRSMLRLAVVVAAVASAFVVGPTPAHAVDDQSCPDFATQKDAQDHLRADPDDPDGLDGPPGRQTGGDPGVACEDNPCPCDRNNVYAQQATSSTVPVTAPPTTASITAQYIPPPTTRAAVVRRRQATVANTGPNDYLWFVAGAGLVAVGAGLRMRGRRAEGAHFS